jgi:hypothetical protein
VLVIFVMIRHDPLRMEMNNMGKIEEVVKEVVTSEEANALHATGRWGKPRYSDKRDCYVMVALDEKRSRKEDDLPKVRNAFSGVKRVSA